MATKVAPVAAGEEQVDWLKDIIPVQGRDAVGEATAKGVGGGHIIGAVIGMEGKKPTQVLVFRQGGKWLAYPALGVDKPVRQGALFRKLKGAVVAAGSQDVRVFDHVKKGDNHALCVVHPYVVKLDGAKVGAVNAVELPVLNFLKKA